MVYYIGLLIMFSLLNVVYKFPLSEAKGSVAKIFRDQWPGDIMQITACYTQLIIIVGLCMDGGKSLTGAANQSGVHRSKDSCITESFLSRLYVTFPSRHTFQCCLVTLIELL